MTRSASGADINEKNFSQYVPIERLSEVIRQQIFLKNNIYYLSLILDIALENSIPIWCQWNCLRDFCDSTVFS